MKLFMDEFYKKYKNRNITIIMDGAGWHKDFQYLLRGTKKIKIILQPPYSPELNPVEKLWQYIKDKTIKNRIYETIEELEDIICEFVKNNLNPEIIRSVCNVKYV
jgi:transposase